MKYDVMLCRIAEKKQLSHDVFDLTVEAGPLAEAARPGQFAQIYVPGKTLRRPISICGIDRSSKTLRFVFQVRGEGTAWLAETKAGDFLNILAPLGTGYELGDTCRKAVFVGGGIGVPPLLEAAKPFGENATAVLGFRDKASIILKEDFEKNGNRVWVATDDGSCGHHGFMTDLLEDLDFDVLYACGPAPMLKAVCKLAAERKVPCQISLEERMACGIGACLGCACRLKKDGREYYGHVCKDGPVFNAENVVWEG